MALPRKDRRGLAPRKAPNLLRRYRGGQHTWLGPMTTRAVLGAAEATLRPVWAADEIVFTLSNVVPKSVQGSTRQTGPHFPATPGWRWAKF